MKGPRRVPALIIFGLLAIALAIVVTGCGGGSSSSSSSSTTESSSNNEETSEEGSTVSDSESASSESASVSPEVKKTVEEFTKRPEELVVTTPITKPIPEGLKFDFITCESPGCKEIAEAFQKAAGELGWSAKVITVGFTADSVEKGFNTAIRDDPDGVGAGFVESSTLTSKFEELEKLGIPVVMSQSPEKPEGPIIATLYTHESSERYGRVTADYLVDQGCGEGETLYVQVTGIPVLEILLKAYEGEMAKIAPEAKTEVLNISSADVQSAPERIVGALRANSNITCVFGSSDPVITGLPQEIEAAGLELPKIYSDYGGETTVQYIKSDLATATLPPAVSGDWGYLYADTFARHFAGQSVEPDNKALQPMWIIEKGNAPEKLPFSYVPNLEEKYMKLWHAG